MSFGGFKKGFLLSGDALRPTVNSPSSTSHGTVGTSRLTNVFDAAAISHTKQIKNIPDRVLALMPPILLEVKQFATISCSKIPGGEIAEVSDRDFHRQRDCVYSESIHGHRSIINTDWPFIDGAVLFRQIAQ